MSAAASQRSALLDLLRQAGDEGVSVNDLVDAGGMWWKDRVAKLNNQPGFNIGWVLVDGEKRHYLVAEPDVERPIDTVDLPTTADDDTVCSLGASSSVDGSLSTQLTLIEPEPPSAIDPWADAA